MPIFKGRFKQFSIVTIFALISFSPILNVVSLDRSSFRHTATEESTQQERLISSTTTFFGIGVVPHESIKIKENDG
jgi:hypothetical protein